MVLDRGLTLEQLNLAFEIAVADPNPKTNRRALTVALRDLVSDQEAEGKTKKCLTRVWLNPPPAAVDMIGWARENLHDDVDRRILHLGALLATFPFVGVVAKVIGQHLQSESQIEPRRVREEVRRLLGDRSSVDVGARKAYTTFRNLGFLAQGGVSLQAPAGQAMPVAARIAGWLSHAVVLTRQVESQPQSSVRMAPELLGAAWGAASSTDYPLLEIHASGGEPVLATRHRGKEIEKTQGATIESRHRGSVVMRHQVRPPGR